VCLRRATVTKLKYRNVLFPKLVNFLSRVYSFILEEVDMKTLARLLVLLVLLMFVGCATSSGGGSGSSSSGDPTGKTLTDEDYKRIGIKGTI
jgi:hypothetical protein